MKKIPPFKYYFPKDTTNWITTKIQELIESGDYLTLGKYSEELERQMANYVGSKHAIAVSNGTAALEIILRAIGVQDCDVIVPTNTFAATAFAVIHAGGTPVFADIASDLNMNPSEVPKRLTPKTKAVIPVHIGGLISSRIHELLELAREQNFVVVEDCAHALGSCLGGKKAGSFGLAGGFSFFSTKIITTGEGGMITTDSSEIAEKARLLRDQGKVRGNEVGVIGYNWRFTEFQSIVGIAQLALVEEIIEKRNIVAKIYDEFVEEIPEVESLKIPSTVRHNFYKYILLLGKGRDPEMLRKHLKDKYGIGLGGYVYEAPLHRQHVFRRYVDDIDSFPVADDLCARHISLPVYPQMTSEEARYVVRCLKCAIQDLGWT